MELQWVTCGDDCHWCSFESVELSAVDDVGVYIIWHEGDADVPSRTVVVGSGKIAERIMAHRTDKEILAHRQFGELRVAWVVVDAASLKHVERYLASGLHPLVGDATSDVTPVPVNLPWAA